MARWQRLARFLLLLGLAVLVALAWVGGQIDCRPNAYPARGATEGHVRSILGAPYLTSGGPQIRNWYYRWTIIDSSGRTVCSAVVQFEAGVCVRQTWDHRTDAWGQLLPLAGLLLLGWLASRAAAEAVAWLRSLPMDKWKGCCAACGYNLTGHVSGRCPECGRSTSEEG